MYSIRSASACACMERGGKGRKEQLAQHRVAKIAGKADKREQHAALTQPRQLSLPQT